MKILSKFRVGTVALLFVVAACMAAFAATGGPDAGGYIYIDSGTSGGPGFDFIDISSSGTALGLGDDEYDSDSPIGFTFTFYGNDYTDVDISSNGFLSFNSLGSSYLSNHCPIPDAANPNNAIYGFWDDLDPSDDGSGEIYTETRGDSPNRMFIVQYDDVELYFSEGDTVTFQIILFETSNEILVNYLDVSDSDVSRGDSATFGIENSDGTTALQYRGCNGSTTPTLYSGLAVLYSLQGVADLKVTKFVDRVQVNTDEQITYTIIVENLGPDPAYNVSIRDELMSSAGGSPSSAFSSYGINSVGMAGVDVDIISTGNQVPPGGVVFTADLSVPLPPLDLVDGGLDAPGRWQIIITATPNKGQVVTNHVTVYNRDGAVSYDPDLTNNQDEVSTTVVAIADLQITKDTSPSAETSVTAGETLTYEVVVTNNGPDDAENVVVKDFLFAGVNVVSATGSTGSVTPGVPGDFLNPLVWNIGPMLDAASETLTIVVTVDPDYSDPKLYNGAWVYSDFHDPNTWDNLVNYILDVDTSADLVVTKLDSPNTVAAGEVLSYEILVRNTGPSTARDVIVTDDLPTEVTFLSASVVGGSGAETCAYFEGAHAIVCNLGDIEPGPAPLEQGLRHVLVDVLVRPDTPGPTITNSATVFTGTTDPVPGDNEATEDTDITTVADLEIIKTSEPMKVVVGQQKYYTLTVINHGPSDAQLVEVLDTLPAEVTYEVSSCEQDMNVVGPLATWTIGTLPAGEAVQCEIAVLVDRGAPVGTTIVNTATVSSATTDPNADNDTDTSSNLLLGAGSDLKIEKSDAPDPVTAGSDLTYTLTVTNNGPNIADNIVAEDFLPVGVTFVSATPSQGAFLVGVPGDPARPFTWNIGTLLSAGNATIDIVVNVSVNIPDGTVLFNDAQVSSDSPELDNSDNVASVGTTVQAGADVELTKTDTPDPVVAGEALSYKIEIANTGPAIATNVIVTDALPDEVTFLSAHVEGGTGGETCSYAAGAHTVTCSLGDIEPTTGVGAAGKRFLFIDVLVKADTPATTITNSVSSTSSTPDPDLPDNTDVTEDTDVETEADLAIEKTCEPMKQYVGDQVRYTIVVRNNGPSDAQNVSVVDVIPDESRYESSEPAGVEAPLGTLTFDLGTVPAGEERTILIDVRIAHAPALDTTITNTATVSGSSSLGDPDSSNDQADCITLILDELPDLTGVWTNIESRFWGHLVTGFIQVSNVGTDFSPAFYVRYYLSNDGVTPLMFLGEAPVPAMLPGADYEIPVSHWSWIMSFTGRYLIAVIDFGDIVPETDETNNTAVIQIP